MNSFFTSEEEPFRVGDSDLSLFMNRPYRLDCGFLFLCIQGEAVISTDVLVHSIGVNSKVTLFPGTIFTLLEASDDFQVRFLTFSHSLFEEANYRLGTSFIGFIKENPVYQLPGDKAKLFLSIFPFLITVYNEKENQFRYNIIRNQLQCIFWETYDKTFRQFQDRMNKATLQQDELFKKFMSLIRIHCRTEREVAFYAEKLCITPRYLSFIVRQVTRDKSAKDMINRHLILEIKVLLQSSQLSVQEIALKLNFPDQSYLGRYFKRYTGKSPTDYRASLGE